MRSTGGLVTARVPDSHPPFFLRSLREHAPLSVLLAGALLSVAAIFYIRSEEARGREREFRRRAQNVALRAEDYLGHREETLYALRDLFEFSSGVSRKQFDGIAADLISRQVGIHALEWVPLVPSAERARFVAEARAEGFTNFEFTEHTTTPNGVRRTGDRPIHAPVYYLVPYAGNEPALGFDLASDAEAWPRLLKYAEAGKLVASGRLPLLMPARGGPGWGYITELPVYRRPFLTLSPAERRAELKGYILGIFLLSDVLEEMFTRMGGLGVDVLFLDSSAPPERQFLHYHPAEADQSFPAASPPTVAQISDGLHVSLPLEHAGRRWDLWIRPSAAWLRSQASYRSTFFPGMILGLSALLSLFLRGQQRRAALVRELVAERTSELTESRRQLASLMHTLPGMAFRARYDDGLTVLYASEGTLVLTGYTPSEFIAEKIHYRQLVHPDDFARVRDATRAALADHLPLEIEYRINARDGREKWVLTRGTGVYDEFGKLQFFEGLTIDVTASRLAETERLALERKLLEGQKLESLGLLAGGIAHDFNNLLTSILGNAGIARLALPPGSNVEAELDAIETGATRAAELCRQMLAYAGKGRFVVEPIDLSALAEGLVPLLKISVGHRAELRLELAPDLPTVMADATQLRQIIMNLVLNAADATSGKPGTITLTSGVVHADLALLARCAAGADCTPGNYVFLEVRDNGIGMTPSVRAKIFDPFFTTKFAGRGLGLAAALGIVRSHQGALQVESIPGEGSSFRLLLPPSSAIDAMPAAPCAPAPADWHHPGVALLIDDEESVRQVAGDMLARFGLKPRVADDGQAGLTIFREDPAAIDVVVLDLVMPGLTGEQTLGKLRELRADVRVLLVSGYTEGELLRRFGPERGRLAFLSKPFTREAFADKLRELLG